MPTIQYSKVAREPKHDTSVKAKIWTFLQKLAEDDALPGLHIEPMQQSADSRARTGRVDQFLRAVLYRIDSPGHETTYVYAGTWPHDEAIKRARTRALKPNPVHGVLEWVLQNEPEVKNRSTPHEAKYREPQLQSYLGSHGFGLPELSEQLGFSVVLAQELYDMTSAEQLERFVESCENEWEKDAILGLAVGDTIAKIRADLQLDLPAIDEESLTEEEQLSESLKHPASRMQFTFIDNDDELRRVIEGDDFGAWRVFLHPEQRAYADQHRSGAFRLTGGAGTGKTVVLLHRTRYLSRANPQARVILTTFTKALSAALNRDLGRLDPEISRAESLGKPGVLVRGIDQLAAAVRDERGVEFWAAAVDIFGAPIKPRATLVGTEIGWRDAIDDAGEALPESVNTVSFFDGEYLQVVLPQRVKTREEYFAVRRPGRGVALDRRKRASVWEVVQNYRQSAALVGRISFAEMAAIAAACVERSGPAVAFADHVIVDEAQDLTPLHFQLLRALVAEGPNDLFIADDTHQRIYGQHVVLSRYDIAIRGRSRRLTLNYRTTQENLGFALDVLEGGNYLDAEDTAENTHGYRSARSGPKPQLLGFDSESTQFDAIAAAITKWLDDGVAPGSIALLARTNNWRDQLKTQLADRGVTVASIDSADGSGTSPVAMTMHKAKGHEFSRVVLFDMSQGSIPADWILKDVAAEELPDVLLRERSLLYVAASRARDDLLITWLGKPSELLRT